MKTILSKIKSVHPGSIHPITYRSEKSSKGFTLEKISTLYGRVGVEFRNLASEKGKPHNGNGTSTSYVNRYERLNKEGETLIAFFPMPNMHSKIVSYKVNGKVVASKEDLERMGVPESLYKSRGECPKMLTLKLANILAVG